MVHYIPDGHVFLKGHLEEAPRLDGYTSILEAPAEGKGSPLGEAASSSISNQFWQRGPISVLPRRHRSVLVRERPEGAMIPDPGSRRRRRGKDVERPAHGVFSLNFLTRACDDGPFGHLEAKRVSSPHFLPSPEERHRSPGPGRHEEVGSVYEAAAGERERERERHRDRDRDRGRDLPWSDGKAQGQGTFDELSHQWNSAMQSLNVHTTNHQSPNLSSLPPTGELPLRRNTLQARQAALAALSQGSALSQYRSKGDVGGERADDFNGNIALSQYAAGAEDGGQNKTSEHSLASAAAETRNHAHATSDPVSDHWAEFTDVPLSTAEHPRGDVQGAMTGDAHLQAAAAMREPPSRDVHAAGEDCRGTVQERDAAGVLGKTVGSASARSSLGEGEVPGRERCEKMEDAHHSHQPVEMTGKKTIFLDFCARPVSPPAPSPPVRGNFRSPTDPAAIPTPRSRGRTPDKPFQSATLPGVPSVCTAPQPYSTIRTRAEVTP